MNALVKNKTKHEAELLEGKRAVGCKWVFTIKYESDGEINRYKVHLVAKGLTQTFVVDYIETIDLVAKLNTIRVF